VGMPCEVNSMVKLKQGVFPMELILGATYQAEKSGYRIFPIDVPLPLVDEQWLAQADVVIEQLTWANQMTTIGYRIHRIYPQPFAVK
jgi:Protein of unknown function (DUF2584)